MFHIELRPGLLNQLAEAGVARVAERSSRPIAGAKIFIGVPQELIHAIDNEPIAAELCVIWGVIGAWRRRMVAAAWMGHLCESDQYRSLTSEVTVDEHNQNVPKALVRNRCDDAVMIIQMRMTVYGAANKSRMAAMRGGNSGVLGPYRQLLDFVRVLQDYFTISVVAEGPRDHPEFISKLAHLLGFTVVAFHRSAPRTLHQSRIWAQSQNARCSNRNSSPLTHVAKSAS